MAAKRVNPNRVKLHRSYTVGELAGVLGVHKNSVCQWRRSGLDPVDRCKPMLFLGADIRAFLKKRNAERKIPCPPGTLYCVRCRAARAPALGMIDYVPLTTTSGNVRALCGVCETIIHRRIQLTALATKMPGLAVHMAEAQPRLRERRSPSANCDLERQAAI